MSAKRCVVRATDRANIQHKKQIKERQAYSPFFENELEPFLAAAELIQVGETLPSQIDVGEEEASVCCELRRPSDP
jgi:hypothetical protein